MPTHRTSSQRSQAPRTAAHALHAQAVQPRAMTRAEYLAGFAREVDPEGVLPPEERALRAEDARQAYVKRLVDAAPPLTPQQRDKIAGLLAHTSAAAA